MQALTLRGLRILEERREFPTVENIRSALARGLPEFAPAIGFNDGHFVVVGSGPSTTQFIEEIRAERKLGRPICAVKSAHDLLMDNGIDPDMFVTCERRDRPLKNTNERTVYLIASRCPPSLFDQVQGRNVVLWHCAASNSGGEIQTGATELQWEELDLLPECQEWRGRFGVGGGSTSGLRAIVIGFLLGFRKFILYGFDSCLAADRETKRFTGEGVGSGKKIDVIVGGRRFWCNGAMAHQATEFQRVYELPNITIEAKGDGLIAEILKQRRLRKYAS